MKEYPRHYDEHSSHASAMRLLIRSSADKGVVLDLGCGRSPLAEVAADAGYAYVGLDLDEHALADLHDRGFEVHAVDLAAPDLADRMREVLGDRTLAAVLLLDVLEHVTDPGAVLGQVRSLFTSLGVTEAQLVTSIPNVTHFDLGAKLLAGRWDYLDTGLLDDTHVRFFDELGHARLFASNGWREVDRDDVELEYSEQRFPSDAPFVRPGVPLREFLVGMRTLASPHALTYQFVRRFELDPDASPLPARDPGAPREVFASVVADVPAGADPTVLLADLARQTSDRFEVLVAVEAASVAPAESPSLDRLDARCAGVTTIVAPTSGARLRAAVAAARGRYVCWVGADTRVSPSWIERLATAEAVATGRVLVAGAASLPGTPGEPGPAFFDDLLELGARPLPQSWTDPLSLDDTGNVVPQSFALPVDLLATTDIDLADERPGATTAALVRAIELSGLVSCPGICLAVPRARVLDASHELSLVKGELNEQPFLLPVGSFSAILDSREVVRRERGERSVTLAFLRAAEATAESLAAQVERMGRELHEARLDVLEAERRGVAGRLVRIAKRALRR